MAAIVANTGSNNWNTNAAWVGGVQPTAADDVTIPASASVSIPGATTALCRSLTVAALGTLVFTVGTSLLNIGDGTAGAGNVALSVSSTATITLTGLGTITFVSTSATQQTIDSGGKVLPHMTWNGAAGSWKLSAALTSSATSSHTVSQGSFDTGSFAMTAARFISTGALTRSVTLGSSTMTYSSTTASSWNVTASGMTFSSGTSNLQLTAAATTVTLASLAYYDVTISVGSGLGVLSAAAATLRNLTVSGQAVKDAILSTAAGPTITGVFLLTGNSATNRLLVQSSVLGTQRTITANGSHGAHANVDFQDIKIAGTAGTLTGTSLGDCQGNSTITFDASVTQTATGTASFTWSTHGWTTRVPLPQDDVVINNAFVAGRTITADMPRLGRNIDLSGATGAPTLTWTVAVSSYGNLAMASSVVSAGPTSPWTLFGRGAQTITSNGCVYGSTTRFTVSSFGGSYTLQDDLLMAPSASPNNVQVAVGTLSFNNKNVSTGTILASSGATLTFGTGTITLNNTGAGNIMNIVSGATISAASATFVLGASAQGRTWIGGDKVYGTLTYNAANSPGSLTVTGANSFTTINGGPGRQIILPSSVVTTVTNWNVAGSNNGYLYLPGLAANYASTPDSAALSVTGDIDIAVRVAPDNWTPAAINTLLAKRGATSVQVSYDFYLSAGGNLAFLCSIDGATASSTQSSVAPGFANGTAAWVRVTRLVSNGQVQFFTAADSASVPTSWTQLGTNQTVTAFGLFDSTVALEVGSQQGGTSVLAGKIYRARVLNGIAGTVVFDADFTTKTFGADSFAESSPNAATVTINGAAAIVGDGRVTVNSSTGGTQATLTKLGGLISSDYLKLQDIAVIGGVRAYAGDHSVNAGNNAGWMFSAPHKTDFFRMFAEQRVGA